MAERTKVEHWILVDPTTKPGFGGSAMVVTLSLVLI